eukprot:Seg1068.1 transcript_id=Seg1068.1/GoldUCD/mRNA.D3Y31 product="hypothetical protein" protein_id=Seg1068.1/GoldUCD/D3Y31
MENDGEHDIENIDDNNDGDDQEELEHYMTKFVMQAGKTCYRRKRGGELGFFLNCQLKLLGTISAASEDTNEEHEGHWVIQCSKRDSFTNDGIIKKIFPVSSSFLDSKKQFEAAIRNNLPFITMTGRARSEDLSDFMLHLTQDYESSGVQRRFYSAQYIGFHDPDTWVLSKKVQIKNGKMVPEAELRYHLIRKEVNQMSLTIVPDLVNSFAGLASTMRRIIQLTFCFCKNKEPFLLSMAFTATQLLKRMYDDYSSDETSHAVIQCPSQNVGKTKSLEIIAHGLGILKPHSHPMVLTGGDMTSGTTPKALLECLSHTNMVVLVNEAKNSTSFLETLFTAHDGFRQGSLNSGLKSARGRVLSTTNAETLERYEGRTLNFRFSHDKEFSQHHNKVLLERLQPFAKENLGFIIAWVIHMARLWQETRGYRIEQIQEIVRANMPSNVQWRWTKGMASAIYTYCLIHYSCGLEPDLVTTVKNIILMRRKMQTSEEPSPKKFLWTVSDKILERIERNPDETMTWLNPRTSIKVTGTSKVPAVAIKSLEFNNFVTEKHLDIKKMLESFGRNCFSETAIFCKNVPCSLDDIADKAKCTRAKAHKIPLSGLKLALIGKINGVCGIGNNSSFGRDVAEEDAEEQSTNPLSNDDILTLGKVARAIKHDVGQYINGKLDEDDPYDDDERDVSIAQVLPANKRDEYLRLSPRKRIIFDKVRKRSTEILSLTVKS